MPDKWDLLFTLPNLCPPVPTPFQSGGYAICSAKDPLLKTLASNAGNATSLKMLTSFATARGEAYQPGCFLIRSDILVANRTADSIRAFRNICAVATITACYALRLAKPSAAQWSVAWSDHFEFSPFIAGKNGWVQTIGLVKGADDHIPSQQSSGAFGKPENFSLVIDERLLERLFLAWRRCYQQGRDRQKLLRLFRALEVAFHASLFPDDWLRSINDVGGRLALWVSAFEVLCHPGTKVNKRTVQKVLSDAPYGRKDLVAKRFTTDYGGVENPATLPEALYDDLYWARNQFFHGNPVTATALRYRRSSKYAPLAHVAPALFNAALVSVLGSLKIKGGPSNPKKFSVANLVEYMKSREGLSRVEEGLAAAGKPLP